MAKLTGRQQRLNRTFAMWGCKGTAQLVPASAVRCVFSESHSLGLNRKLGGSEAERWKGPWKQS